MIEPKSLPKHIAIVMDGNGRWAKQRGLPRVAGHKVGSEAARKIIKACAERKVTALTLFAFSSENWQRPTEEINYLFKLFLTVLQRNLNTLKKNNIRIRIIGDQIQLDEKLQKKIKQAENATAANTGLQLNLAINYSGRWDIFQAAKSLAACAITKSLELNNLTPADLQKFLCLHDLPEPDLFIRTSGELRISNFLLWQLAYTELYFTKTLWPDFDERELDLALEEYAKRDRRFGNVR